MSSTCWPDRPRTGSNACRLRRRCASEERFRRYFELGLIGMAITAPTKGYLEVNDETCRILGYSRDELLRKTWAEMTHPDDVAADVAQFDRVMAGETDGYTLDKRWVRKNGYVIDTTVSVKCLRRGRVGQLLRGTAPGRHRAEAGGRGTVGDGRATAACPGRGHVAQRGRQVHNEQLLMAQDRLELERRRYQDLFDTAPDGYLVTDLYGTIRQANSAAAHLLGVEVDRLRREPLLAFIDPPARRSFRRRLIASAIGVAPGQWDVTIRPRGRPVFEASCPPPSSPIPRAKPRRSAGS